MAGENGWNEWSRHVLAELKRLSDGQKEYQEKADAAFLDLKVEIANLKVKSGVWGLVGGAIPVAIGLLVSFFLKSN